MNKRFRVAFSFAGEKRPFVAQVADILAARFHRDQILYDKFHEAEFAVSDLAFQLPNLYYQSTDLVVAILCQKYDQKEWCGLEWNAIYGKIKQGGQKDIMLCRFDRVAGRGLYGLSGFVDLDGRSADETANLILERIALNEGLSRDYYLLSRLSTSGSDWPETAPVLDWPVADHGEAHDAFAQLITRNAPFRMLPIHGGSETGKSHLTKQFLHNAFKIPELTCGRFDFKGSSDMESELRTLASQLCVPTPKDGTGITAQLTEILTALKSGARPSLLIFDTFELAGEGERWVKETLLFALRNTPWLRVIVVGQRVPKRHGEPWAGFTAEAVELRSPSPEEWYEYGRPHKPDIDLNFVRRAHEICGGKSTVLAQLLGPA